MSLSLHSDFLKLPNTERYLLGISGGRDSVALLHLLLEKGYHHLVLCHLNHGMRGEESTKDAQLVIDLADTHQLPSEIQYCDTSELMKEYGESMELAARNARHRFFHHCAVTYSCPRLLLAHHADDQAETILFNLLRGSRGLRGMSFQTEHKINNKTLTFYRPLLNTNRSSINNYLEDKNIYYRDDATNTQPVATRNRLRNEAIPLLTSIMGRDISSAILRAEETCNLNEMAVRDILATHRLKDPQGRLFTPKLKELHPALQRMAIHDYLNEHSIADISNRLLTECLNLLNDPSTTKINLPGGSFFRRKEKRLFIETSKS